MKIFNINHNSEIPKYQQVVNIILDKLKEGILKRGDILPSLNNLVQDYSVSRDTINKAYNILKKMNIIDSIQGKAFYIKNDYLNYDKRVFVLFDVLQTPYKEILYKGIIENINDRIHLEFYFHNFNPDLFKRLVEENIGDYDYYVIMPFPNAIVLDTLRKIDQKKLLLLDIDVDFEGKECSAISQNHDYELDKVLNEGIDLIKKYSEVILVFPEDKNHPIVIKEAFRRFCKKNKIASKIITKTNRNEINKNTAYLIIESDDLVNIIKTSKEKEFIIGKDVGIISYNDTPLKEVVENGITVVSVDFYEMGRKTAAQILQNRKINVLEPTNLIIRNSL